MRAWPCREYYGMVVIYYDADGNLDPPYELDPYQQIDSGQFVYRGTYSEWVDMHIQEFAENAVVGEHRLCFSFFIFYLGNQGCVYCNVFFFLRLCATVFVFAS